MVFYFYFWLYNKIIYNTKKRIIIKMNFLLLVISVFVITYLLYLKIYCLTFYDFCGYINEQKLTSSFEFLKPNNFIDSLKSGDLLFIKNKPYVSNITNFYLADFFNHGVIILKKDKELYALDIMKPKFRFFCKILEIRTISNVVSKRYSNIGVVIRFQSEISNEDIENYISKIMSACKSYNSLPMIFTKHRQRFPGFYNCLDICKEFLIERKILSEEYYSKEINFSDILFQRIPMNESITKKYIFFVSDF